MYKLQKKSLRFHQKLGYFESTKDKKFSIQLNQIILNSIFFRNTKIILERFRFISKFMSQFSTHGR